MDFTDLEYIVAVAEDRNLSRAAERLIVAQPTLSKTLARLEKAVGLPLFLRRRHGLELTGEGERFVETARKLLKAKRDLDDEMRTIAEGRAGRIRLGISHTFSRDLVPRVLPAYAKSHPHVEVIIHTETSSILERLLRDDVVDVAVMVERELDGSLFRETLFHEPLLLAVSGENPICRRARVIADGDHPFLDPAHLRGQRFILSQERMRLRQSAEAFFRAEGITPETAVTTASTMTALHLASYGVGIAFLPLSFTLLNLEPPLPRFFATADTLEDWKVVIALRRKNRASPLLKSFIKTFKEAM